MLTISDFVDLIAEHTTCRCPADASTNGNQAESCPKHRAIRAHREAAQDDDWPIPQDLFPLEQFAAQLSEWDGDTPRVVIAVLLWRVTAEFAGDSASLSVPTGRSISDTAEQYVRDHWKDAESNHASRLPESLGEFLSTVALLGDYERVKQDGRDVLRTRRSFSIPGEARYGDTVRRGWARGVRAELNAGLDVLGDDGEPDGTCLGEWQLSWTEPYGEQMDVELRVPADAWKAFANTQFPALLAELGMDNPDEPVPTIDQVVQKLLSAGWIDMTVRSPASNRVLPGAGVDRQEPAR